MSRRTILERSALLGQLLLYVFGVDWLGTFSTHDTLICFLFALFLFYPVLLSASYLFVSSRFKIDYLIYWLSFVLQLILIAGITLIVLSPKMLLLYIGIAMLLVVVSFH